MLNSINKPINKPIALLRIGLFSAFIGTLLFKANVNSMILILLCGTLFFETKYKDRLLDAIKSPVILSLILFYSLHILAVLYSENTGRAFKDLILKIPLLLVPLIFVTFRLPARLVYRFLNFFLAALFIYGSYTLWATCQILFPDINPQNFSSRLAAMDWAYFSYILPNPINVHAPYLSLHLCCGVLVLFWFLNRPAISKIVKFFYLLLIFYFLSLVTLISSRTSFISLGFILVVWVVQIMLVKKKYWLALGGGLFILASFYLALHQSPYLRLKIQNFDGISERLVIWNACWDLIKENLVIGVGTGDIKDLLIKKYTEIGFTSGIKQTLNAHNQYLQTWVGLGASGVLSFLLIFIFLLKESIRKKNNLLMFITILFILCSVTESIFSRQSGIILFCFLVGLLLPLNEGELDI